MSRFPMYLAALAILAFGLGLGGCAPQETPSEPETSGAETEAEAEAEHEGDADHDHGDEEEGSHSHDEAQAGSDVEEALAMLSEAEQAAARAQKTCPVSDDPLGAMGKPYKVTVNGQDVFLCCQHCEAAITEDPDKYLAKLAK